MKTLKSMMLAVLLLTTFSSIGQTKKDQKIIKDAEMAKQKLLEADAGISSFFDTSVGYVIFPNVGEGALVIGGASGNGVLYENGIAIGMADLKKIDVGIQAGGQAIIEAVFFETEQALDKFKTGNFTFTAEASAVVLKTGVAVNAKYDQGVLVFALPKAGLMADASIGGQKFKFKEFR